MIRRLLALQRAAWSVALRASVLPVTTLLRRTDRHLAWRLDEVCFGARRPGVYREVQLASLIGRSTSIRILELPAETYNVSETELLALAAITSHLQPHAVFEFGTADGRTTRNLAANVEPSGHVYTLNIPVEQDSTHYEPIPVGCRFLGTPEADRITQLWGDSRIFGFEPYYGRCQVIFIDADHVDAAVWSDSHAALRLVDARRGMILWHDALRYGVQTALPRLMQQDDLPIHLIAGTNLAFLCFAQGRAMMPGDWVKEISTRA
jgi:predicted O-methyltransferase YrrM